MSFSEERLDLGYDYGTVATITTKTSIIESKNGTEQRTPQWYQPLLQFNIGERSEINDQLDQLIAFYQARKGAYQGFRFKDWSDYQFSTIITLDANKQAQLFKAYSVAGFTVKRSLIKIVPGSILVSVGNSPVTTGWTVNFNTGIITFDQVQTEPIQVSGEFDVPVRFATDKINLRFEAFEACEPESNLKLFSLENLSLTEIRINPTLALSLDQIPQSLDHQINLGYDYGTIGGNEFATRIERLISGHETRISEWTTNRGSWEVGSRTLLKSELDYLIALFRVCRGKAVSFKYFNWQSEEEIIVRFGEDAIAFRFDAYEKGTGRVLFNLAGVPLQQVINPILEDDDLNAFVVLNGLRWELPCINQFGGFLCNTPQNIISPSTILQGNGVTYNVTLRFRGLVELNEHYQNGSTLNSFFQVGGIVGSGNLSQGMNVYKLIVSSPNQTYFVNKGPSTINLSIINYTVTIPISSSATVTLEAITDPDFGQIGGSQIRNWANLVVPDIAPFPSVYNGQFLQMDVVSIVPVP